MQWYEYIFGISSVLGLFVSVLTLITTRRTKAALNKFRFFLDLKDQSKKLSNVEFYLQRSKENWSPDIFHTCQSAIDQISITYKDQITDGLDSALDTFRNKLVMAAKEPENINLQAELTNDLSTVNILLDNALNGSYLDRHESISHPSRKGVQDSRWSRTR